MDRLFTCELCSRSFSQSSTLEQHKQTHEEKKPYKCIYCDQSFQSYFQLSTHVGISETEPKAHKCSFCCLSFAEAACLSVHAETHKDDKSYKCRFCGERFTSSSFASQHEKSHFAEKLHKCGLCYRTYSDAVQLAKHFQVHTGIKPYKCDYCERTFSKSNKRTVHLRSHTGERPYRCAYCDKGFADSDKLNIHIRTHTGERPYTCEYCQRSFTRSDKRNQHTRNVHKKELASKFIYHPTEGLQLLQSVTSELPYMTDGFEVTLHHPPLTTSASTIPPTSSFDEPNPLPNQTDFNHVSIPTQQNSTVSTPTSQISTVSVPTPQITSPDQLVLPQQTASPLQNKYKKLSYSLTDAIKEPGKQILAQCNDDDVVPGDFLQVLNK